MSQPMLSFTSETPSGETPKATAHLLPCRIHHTGPVESAESFWDPKAGESTNEFLLLVPSHLGDFADTSRRFYQTAPAQPTSAVASCRAPR